MAHGNARTTLRVRFELVQMIERGVPVARAAARCGTSRQTAYKWLDRYRGGEPLTDRSSRPKSCPKQSDGRLEARVVKARHATGYGPARLGGELGIPGSTTYKILVRAGCNRLPREPREPIVRYEREAPGDLLHVDTKRLGRFEQAGHRVHGDRRTQNKIDRAGFEYVHVAIDDRTRLAYVEIADAQDAAACSHFLERACDWFERNGIHIQRVMTDNALAYKSHAWNDVCDRRGIKRRYTRNYRPQTNGKAERLIRTLLNEWAYADAYPTSNARAKTLGRWCDNYNTRRYHTSCKSTPWQRAASDLARVNNVRGHYS